MPSAAEDAWAKSQVEPEDALRDGALRRCGMEQVSDDVRGSERVREGRLSEGAFLRTAVQGAEGGQDAGGLLHQAVGLLRPVPCRRHELQSGREGAAHPLFGEEGDGVALQAGAAYHRTRKAESENCGIVKRTGGEMVAKKGVEIPLCGTIACNGRV